MIAGLMVLSIGAGSLLFSHVNDAGFWLFKEYFKPPLNNFFKKLEKLNKATNEK